MPLDPVRRSTTLRLGSLLATGLLPPAIGHSESANRQGASSNTAGSLADVSYVTSDAGTGKLTSLPLSKFSFDLATDSFVFSIGISLALPAAPVRVAGNIESAVDGFGFYLSGRASGVLAPVFNAAGGNWTHLTGYPASVLGTAVDGNDHTVTIAYDAPTRSVYYFLDGVLKGSFTNVISPGTSSRSRYPFALGSTCGFGVATGTGCGLKRPKACVWAGQGLPLNIAGIVKSLYLNPSDAGNLFDVHAPTKSYSTIAWLGQSNEVGSSDSPDESGEVGAPTRDTVTAAGSTSMAAAITGSMHPQIARLGGKRGTWRVTLNTAQGATSIAQYWVGQFCAWVPGAIYSKGAYLIARGNVYKLTSSTNRNSPNVAVVSSGPVSWPDTGAVADGEAVWTHIRAATSADIAGTVLTATNPLFDPNGALAAIKRNLDAMPSVFAGRKFVCISIGQTDKTVGTSKAQYTAAIQSATNYLLSCGYKVLIGFTNSGITPGMDSWLSNIGKPGREAALASFAGNPSVTAGADLYAALGVLTVRANDVGLLADRVHMNRHAMPLAASYWDVALSAVSA